MQRNLNIKNKRNIILKVNERRTLVKFAKIASRDAKRASKAMSLSYDIIKDGSFYKVFQNDMIKIAEIQKINVEKSNLKKGSVICLKSKD